MSGGVATVARLAVSVTGDVDGLKTSMAEAQSVVGAAAKDIAVNVSAVSDSTDQVTAAGKRMVAALQEEVRTFGMSREEILVYKASLTGAGAEVERLVGQLQALKAAQAAAPQLNADADATQRIKDMVAASVAQSAAMNNVAGATQTLTSAQAGAARVTASWAESQRLQAQNMAGVTASMRAATAGTQELSAQTQAIMNRYDPLGTKLRSLQSDLAVLRKEMGNSVDPAAIKAFEGLENEIDKTRALMIQAGAEGFGAMEGGAQKSAFATAGATRELMVLGHEVISGNFSKIPGSLMVLAERVGSFGTLASAAGEFLFGMGGAATAAVGPLALVAAATYQAHQEFLELNKAIGLTSNYAGQTRDSINDLAQQVGAAGQMTVGSAKDMVTAMVASGRIGGDALASISMLAANYARATGTSVEELTPKLIALFEDPKRSADELQSSMHLLTAADVEYIRSLEDTGQHQQAQLVLAQQLGVHLALQAKEVSALAAAWQGVKEKASEFWQAAKEYYSSDDSYKVTLRAAQDTLAMMLNAPVDMSKQIDAQKKYIASLIAGHATEQAAAQQAAAAASADADRKKAIADELNKGALRRIDLLKEEYALLKDAPSSAAVEQRKAELLDQIQSIQRSIGEEDRQLTQQQITSQEALREVSIKSAAEAINTKYKLGQITQEQFAMQMTNNSLEENMSKQIFERRMANVAGLTTAERQAHLDKLKLLQAEASLIEQKGASTIDIDTKAQYDAIIKATVDAGAARIASLDKQILAQREHNAEIGKTKSQIELAKQAQEDLETVQLQSDADYLRDGLAKWDLDDKARAAYQIRLNDLDAEIERRRTLASLHGTGSTLEANAKATADAAAAQKRLADMAIQDWQRAGSSIADSLSTAFGTGGKAIGQMFKAYADGVAGQLKSQKELAEAKKLTDDNPEKFDAMNRAQLAGAQAQIKSYGDMAQAAQGFFEQGSSGYKAMAAATEVLRVAEVGLSIVKGVNAVLTQGEGDPYSAFARMAAMAALVAGLGVALSGGSGGGVSAADRQKAQGTGSVLGDSNAKSDSIAHSVALAAANSSTQIDYLSGMLTSLRAIESNIGSFASQVVQNSDISNPKVNLNTNNGFASTVGTVGMTAGGAALGAAIAGPIGMIAGALIGAIASKIPVIGNLMTSIFGGKQSLQDSGFTMSKASLASILSQGANAQTYADIKTSGGWFKGDKTNTQETPLGADANQQFTLVLKSMSDGIHQAADLLGAAGSDFDMRLSSFVVDIGKVSLKGLTGEEQQKALEAVFSKLGDQMAQYAVAGLSQFQKVGEGYLETLTRVATDYAKVDASLTSIGMKFGAVGISSIAARESLIDLAGGIDKLQSDAASFSQNFLSKAEQLEPVAKYVNDQLAALGLSGIDTRDAFKQVVLGLDLSTASGQKEYTALMALQSAFAATHAATVDLSKTEQEIADERKGLQDQLDQLTMSQSQLLTKQRNALDASNRALFDQVQAAQKAKDAQDAVKSSLGTLISQMTSFRDSTKSLHDSLLAGSLSTLSPEQQYAELRRQYEETKAKASAGDVASQNNYANALNAFLTFSQKINGADAQYQADFAMGQSDSAAMSEWAANQVDVNQAQLDAMNSQVAAMNAANATLNSIALGIDNLPVALSSTPINPANYGGSDGMAALVAEIKSLNAKVDAQNQIIAGLRADQQKQTGDTIVANAEVQQQTAQTIVSGLGGIITKTATSAQKVLLE